MISGATNFRLFSILSFSWRRSVLIKLGSALLCSSPFPPRHGDPFRARLSLSGRCVSLLACCTRSRAISPGLTRGGSRELQLQLHARWGYAGLGRVRCTSRPSVCPRPASSLPSVTSPPPASPALSTFFVHPSFFLLLLRVLSPHPRARRRLLPLSKSPAETCVTCKPLLASHMDTRGRDTFVCVLHESTCVRTCVRICMRVSVSPRVSCPPSRKRRYDTIFGQCDSRHDVRFSKRMMDSLSGM